MASTAIYRPSPTPSSRAGFPLGAVSSRNQACMLDDETALRQRRYPVQRDGQVLGRNLVAHAAGELPDRLLDERDRDPFARTAMAGLEGAAALGNEGVRVAWPIAGSARAGTPPDRSTTVHHGRCRKGPAAPSRPSGRNGHARRKAPGPCRRSRGRTGRSAGPPARTARDPRPHPLQASPAMMDGRARPARRR